MTEDLETSGNIRLYDMSDEQKAFDKLTHIPTLFGVMERKPLEPLSAKALKEHEIKVSKSNDTKGELVRDEKPYTSGRKFFRDSEFEPGPENYVVLETGQIIVGWEHHSVLAGGMKVVCAGSQRSTNGKLELLTDDSGHYLPPPSALLQLVYYFRKAGLDVSQTKLRIRHQEFALP